MMKSASQVIRVPESPIQVWVLLSALLCLYCLGHSAAQWTKPQWVATIAWAVVHASIITLAFRTFLRLRDHSFSKLWLWLGPFSVAILLGLAWNAIARWLPDWPFVTLDYVGASAYAVICALMLALPRRSRTTSLLLDFGREKRTIVSTDVEAVKAAGNYLEIFVTNQSQPGLLRCTLKDFHHRLPHLTRCHRSYLVDPQAIEHLEVRGREIVLQVSGGHRLPVSQRYKNMFVPAPA